MPLFRQCKNCGHTEEEHLMEAPEGARECLLPDCNCDNFEPDYERELVPA